MLNSSFSMQRDSEQDNGHSSDLERRKRGTLLVKTVHKRTGQNCWADDVKIRRKHTPSLSIYDSIVQRSA